jgi:hypothetical protein
MSAQYTDITILLDRSGSMDAIKTPMESALDEFLLAHKKVPSTRVSLIQFDNTNPQEAVYIDCPVADAPRTVIEPRGTTPLLDALCFAIDHTGLRLQQKADADRPDQVLFVIITDGLENASHTSTRIDVRRRTEHQTAVYKWQFVYLGANQDAIHEAELIGIHANQAVSYQYSGGGAQAAVGAMVVNTVSFAGQHVNRGSSRSLAFSDEQREAAMDPAVTLDDDEEDEQTS